MLTDAAGLDAAGADYLWEAGEVVTMTPEQAKVWADGVRGELVRTTTAVETPESSARRRGGTVHTPEGRSR